MQYFLGLEGYTYDRVFDPSLFVSIRKRLGLVAFNEMTNTLIERVEEIEAAGHKKKIEQQVGEVGRPPPSVGAGVPWWRAGGPRRGIGGGGSFGAQRDIESRRHRVPTGYKIPHRLGLVGPLPGDERTPARCVVGQVGSGHEAPHLSEKGQARISGSGQKQEKTPVQGRTPQTHRQAASIFGAQFGVY